MANGVQTVIAITPPPRIVRFRSNLVQSLTTWQPIQHRLSRSKNQRSRSQHNVTYQQEKNVISQERIGRPTSILVKISLNAERNVWRMFNKVIACNRQEVEIWLIFDLCSLLVAKLLLSFMKSKLPNLVAMSEFWRDRSSEIAFSERAQ